MFLIRCIIVLCCNMIVAYAMAQDDIAAEEYIEAREEAAEEVVNDFKEKVDIAATPHVKKLFLQKLHQIALTKVGECGLCRMN